MTSKKESRSTAAGRQENQAATATPSGTLTYNSYLKVAELKQLQLCQSDPPHHDEMLFIVIHQAYELWFKIILHELDAVFQRMAENSIRRATFYMRRVNEIMKLLVRQIHILETMAPRDFLGFRYTLSPASGFGSGQFREIEFIAGMRSQALLNHFRDDPAYETLKARYYAPSLEQAFYALLAAHGFELPQPAADSSDEAQEKAQEKRLRQLIKLYDEEDRYGELHDLAEAFVEFDELVSLWRSNHVIVVERMIGFKRGTGGSEGVGYLQTTLSKRCFADLWRLRTMLEQAPHEKAIAGTTETGTAASGCPFHSQS